MSPDFWRKVNPKDWDAFRAFLEEEYQQRQLYGSNKYADGAPEHMFGQPNPIDAGMEDGMDTIYYLWKSKQLFTQMCDLLDEGINYDLDLFPYYRTKVIQFLSDLGYYPKKD